MDTIKFPLSFKNGVTEKLIENTDQYWAQFLAMMVRVESGEMLLEPTYGINDPTFSQLDVGRVKLVAGRFYPEIDIESVTVQRPSASGSQKIKISYSF